MDKCQGDSFILYDLVLIKTRKSFDLLNSPNIKKNILFEDFVVFLSNLFLFRFVVNVKNLQSGDNFLVLTMNRRGLTRIYLS